MPYTRPMPADTLRRFVTLYLPSSYKNRANITQAGVAETGEISDLGATQMIEHWDGRQEVVQQPSTCHIVFDSRTGKWRDATRQELLAKGLIVVGSGPTGIQRYRQGIRFHGSPGTTR